MDENGPIDEEGNYKGEKQDGEEVGHKQGGMGKIDSPCKIGFV